ncbi:MAG: ribosome maturation factor RimM [Kiloniellales bacterium]
MPHRAQPVCLGVIAGAHGARGLVRIRSSTQRPSDIDGYGELTDEAGERHFSLKVTGRTKGALVARIDGVRDHAAADSLKGTRLYVPRDRLPAPAADEYYYADLIGLAVELADGTSLGTVRGVDNFGAGDVLDVAPPPAGRAIVVPFTRAAVPVVDLECGRIVVNPLPGLIAAADDAAGDRAAER